jgi:pentatricopeptide repeat protein
MAGCVKGGQYELALALLDEMVLLEEMGHEEEHQSISPNVINFAVALSACKGAARGDRALEILQMMNHHGVEVSPRAGWVVGSASEGPMSTT